MIAGHVTFADNGTLQALLYSGSLFAPKLTPFGTDSAPGRVTAYLDGSLGEIAQLQLPDHSLAERCRSLGFVAKF